MAKFSLSFDTSVLASDVETLRNLMGAEEFFERVSNLESNIVFGDFRSTLGAGGTQEIVVTLRFDDAFERLRTAVLAGELPDFAHSPTPAKEYS